MESSNNKEKSNERNLKKPRTKKNNNDTWLNSNNESLNSSSKSIVLDENTVIIGLNCHGEIIISEPCLNLSSNENLEYLQKISLGNIGCVNFLNSSWFGSCFDIMNNYIFDSKPTQSIDFLNISRMAYKSIRPKTKKNHRATRSEASASLFHLDSDYHHRSFIYDKESTNVDSRTLLEKRYEFMIADANNKPNDKGEGIYVLYDGKCNNTSLHKTKSLLLNFPYRKFKNKRTNIVNAKFKTSEIINFFLEKGYTKILIHDLSCNFIHYSDTQPPGTKLCSSHY